MLRGTDDPAAFLRGSLKSRPVPQGLGMLLSKHTLQVVWHERVCFLFCQRRRLARLRDGLSSVCVRGRMSSLAVC